MGTTLENGVYLPSEGERNCYAGLKTNWEILDQKVADVTALQQAVAGALHREIVESLPTTDIDPNTIYMVLSGTSATENVYNEFMYVNNAWELIGTSATDLTNYYTKSEVDGKLLLKANDSDVVHKTGDETVGGQKTFNNNTYITSLNFTSEVESQSSSSSAVFPIVTTVTYADQSPSQTARLNFRVTANGDKSLYPHENNQYSFGVASRRWTTLYGYLANLGGTYVGNEASANERSNLYLLANRDTDGQSGAYIGRFRQNRAQGAMSGGDVSFVSFDFLENSTRYTRCFTMGLTDWDSDGVPQTYYITAPNDKGSLGTSYQQWNKVYANEYYYGSNNVEFSTKFVTTDTAQTIAQNKTFTGVITINHVKGGVLQLTCPDLDNTVDVTGNWATFISFNSVDGGQTVASKGAVGLRQFKDGKNFALLLVEGSETLYFGSKSKSDSTKALYPANSGVCSLGTSTNKWSTINGVEPSSLGMPDLSNGIDISSYIPALDSGNTQGSYTPSVNGFIVFRGVASTGGCSIVQGNMGNNASYITDPQTSNKIVNNFLPVIKDNPVVITVKGLTSIESIYFYPCQGNI